MFTSLLLSSIVLAAVPASPVPDATLLRDEDTCYALQRKQEDAWIDIGVTRQTVEHAEANGRAVLKVMVHQHGMGGSFDMQDFFVLNAENLRPISFENFRNGERHVALTYSDTRVSGEMLQQDGSSTKIDVKLDAPVWEGNLFGLTFAALPLQGGEEYHLPFYQYDKGLGEFVVKVNGPTSFEKNGKTVDAISIDGGTEDGKLINYVIGLQPRRELAYLGENFRQVPGGDCSTLQSSSR